MITETSLKLLILRKIKTVIKITKSDHQRNYRWASSDDVQHIKKNQTIPCISKWGGGHNCGLHTDRVIPIGTLNFVSGGIIT